MVFKCRGEKRGLDIITRFLGEDVLARQLRVDKATMVGETQNRPMLGQCEKHLVENCRRSGRELAGLFIRSMDLQCMSTPNLSIAHLDESEKCRVDEPSYYLFTIGCKVKPLHGFYLTFQEIQPSLGIVAGLWTKTSFDQHKLHGLTS